MSRDYLVLGSVDYVPQHSGLERAIADFGRDDVLLAIHYERLHPNTRRLFVGCEEILFAQRLARLGAVTYLGETAYEQDCTALRVEPIITVLPSNERSLWEAAESLQRSSTLPVTVIPRPLQSLHDYVQTLTALLPDLQAASGDMRKTAYFERELGETCEHLVHVFKEHIASPHDQKKKEQLGRTRAYLELFFPSDRGFNRELNYRIQRKDYNGVRELIHAQLFPIDGPD